MYFYWLIFLFGKKKKRKKWTLCQILSLFPVILGDLLLSVKFHDLWTTLHEHPHFLSDTTKALKGKQLAHHCKLLSSSISWAQFSNFQLSNFLSSDFSTSFNKNDTKKQLQIFLPITYSYHLPKSEQDAK